MLHAFGQSFVAAKRHTRFDLVENVASHLKRSTAKVLVLRAKTVSAQVKFWYTTIIAAMATQAKATLNFAHNSSAQLA